MVEGEPDLGPDLGPGQEGRGGPLGDPLRALVGVSVVQTGFSTESTGFILQYYVL